jgi:hypothetical protein
MKNLIITMIIAVFGLMASIHNNLKGQIRFTESLPAIGVSPDTVYMNVFADTTDSASFTIYNNGDDVLQIYGIDIEAIAAPTMKAACLRKHRPQNNILKYKTPFKYTEETGGPDDYGYKWIDSDAPGGPVYDWADISAIGDTIAFSNTDDGTTPVILPFTFTFYGIEYDMVNVCTNGFINFDAPYYFYMNTAIPSMLPPNSLISLLWDDLMTDEGTVMSYYDADNNRFIIQYNVHPFGNFSEQFIFQVHLYQNGNILAQYHTAPGPDYGYTVGIESTDGSTGLGIAHNESYLHDELAILYHINPEWIDIASITDSIQPGDSLTVPVHAATYGMYGGDYQAKIIIRSNDTTQPVIEKPIVKLHVAGVSEIEVTPNILIFTDEYINYPDTLTVFIENTGSDMVQISSLTNGNSKFSILTSPPFNISAGENREVKVAYVSTTAGLWIDTLKIYNNGIGGQKTVLLVANSINKPTLVSDTLVTATMNPNDTLTTELIIRNTGLNDLEYTVVEKPYVIDYSTDTSSLNAYGVSLLCSPVFNKFNLNRPGHFVAQGPTINLSAGDFSTNGELYFGVNSQTNEFGTIDTKNGGFNLIGTLDLNPNQSVTGLTFDPTSEMIYLSVNNFLNSELYTVNPLNAAITRIGNITGMAGAIDIAASQDGHLYSYDVITDYFYQIDKRTGAATCIGPLGFNANYTQGMDFNPDDSVCYLAAYNYADVRGELRTVDLSTGATTLIGVFPDNTPVDGLGILSVRLPWIEPLPLKGNIAPGDSAKIYLSWYGIPSPDGKGKIYDGYLSILSNDPALPIMNVHASLEVKEKSIWTGIDHGNSNIPFTYLLHQNYPNPFNPTTTIKYDIKEPGTVRLKIYNTIGQEVKTLINGYETAGYKSVIWDGKDNSGNAVSSGLYVYRIEAGKYIQCHKMLLVK